MSTSDEEAHRLLDLALGEFHQHGKVENIRCHLCGDLIVITEISSTAWKIECPCGKFNGNLWGL